MNLDDMTRFREIDGHDMLSHINGLPDQLQTAWDLGASLPLPDFGSINNVVISGMGGSAIGADLLCAYINPVCQVPVIVHRDYGLPGWVTGSNTLLIASSHSGNTEETLSSFEEGRLRGCRILSISTGGKLAAEAKKIAAPAWVFDHRGMPRAAVGFSFGLLLSALVRLGLVPDAKNDLQEAITVMRQLQLNLVPEIPVIKNPAKRLAGQLIGRYVNIFGSGYLAPVARRWKGQVNELAKGWAQFEFLPEGDHNTLAGLANPPKLLNNMASIFLRAPSDHPRNCLRIELTMQAFMQQGMNTDTVDAIGNGPMAHIWSTLLYGDYVGLYLAIAYGTDPTPIDALFAFKDEMNKG
jgi:glucose/mannose-6-phosphate isomerase